jgi:hypothetical protein
VNDELQSIWKESVMAVILLQALSQYSRSPGEDLNPGPPEYETGVLSIGPRSSVKQNNNATHVLIIIIIII